VKSWKACVAVAFARTRSVDSRVRVLLDISWIQPNRSVPVRLFVRLSVSVYAAERITCFVHVSVCPSACLSMDLPVYVLLDTNLTMSNR